MISYVKATVDGTDYYLAQNGAGQWVQLMQAPAMPGDYDVTLTAVAQNGAVTIINSDDPELGQLLTLIVNGDSVAYYRMLDYLPPYWHDFVEMQQLLKSDGYEIDKLLAAVQQIYTDAFILTASDERIAEWEKDLAIIPNGTLEQRRLYVLSKLRGVGKLNEAKIQSVVSAFTGGGAIVTFANSTINVKVLPPNNGDIFLFPDIERTLQPMKPAHLGLVVERYYSSWGDIKNQFTSWQDVNNNKETWQAVRNHIVR